MMEAENLEGEIRNCSRLERKASILFGSSMFSAVASMAYTFYCKVAEKPDNLVYIGMAWMVLSFAGAIIGDGIYKSNYRKRKELEDQLIS